MEPRRYRDTRVKRLAVLYISDLDFTLLRSDLSISSYTKYIWNKVASNNKISIATARSYTGVSELLKGLNLKEPLILLDGTIIATPSGDIIQMSAINKELGNEVIDIVAKSVNLYPLIVALIDGKEEFFYPKVLNSYQKELLKTMQNRRRVFANEKLTAKDNNLKIVYLSSKEDAAKLTAALKEVLGNNIEIKSSQDPYIDCYFTTILHPQGDKAHALAKLEEIEGVNIENTTVFGDSHNDIGLFKKAGTKVAVANAIDELKELASTVLPHTNDEDAVAKYLDNTLFNK